MHLGQRGADWASKWAGRVGMGRPAWAHFGPVRGLLRPVLLPESSISSPLLHEGPCRQFLFELDEAPCLARFDTFLARSSEFVIFSGLVIGLLGVVFTRSQLQLEPTFANFRNHQNFSEIYKNFTMKPQIIPDLWGLQSEVANQHQLNSRNEHNVFVCNFFRYRDEQLCRIRRDH
jgi:hypothetical protein